MWSPSLLQREILEEFAAFSYLARGGRVPRRGMHIERRVWTSPEGYGKYLAERRAFRRKVKGCLWCKAPAVSGRALCEKHLEAGREAARKRYWAKKNETRGDH